LTFSDDVRESRIREFSADQGCTKISRWGIDHSLCWYNRTSNWLSDFPKAQWSFNGQISDRYVDDHSRFESGHSLQINKVSVFVARGFKLPRRAQSACSSSIDGGPEIQ
jgi:hypothetical protein